MGWGVAAGAAIGAVGDYLGSSHTGKQNAKQARISREWQAEQSNTAVQRRMEDLKKAGMNPMLAYMGSGTGGTAASTPSGATAQSGDFGQIGSRAVNSAMAVKQATSNVKLQEASAQNQLADAAKKDVERKIQEVSPDYQAWRKSALEHGGEAGEVSPRQTQLMEETAAKIRNLNIDSDMTAQQLLQNKTLLPYLKDAAELANRGARADMPLREAEGAIYSGAKGKYILGAEKGVKALSGLPGNVIKAIEMIRGQETTEEVRTTSGKGYSNTIRSRRHR